MKRFLKPMVAALALGAGVAAAAPSWVGSTPVVFVAVDSVEVNGPTFMVTGVVEGQQVATQWLLTFSSSSQIEVSNLEACHRAGLVAMAKPGAYRLTLSDTGTYGYPRCALSRATP